MDPEDWTFGKPDPKEVNDYWWYHVHLSVRKRYLFMAAVGMTVSPLTTEPECVRASQLCADYAEGEFNSNQFWDGIEEANRPAAGGFVTFLGDDGKLNECVEAAVIAFGYAAAISAGDLAPDDGVPAWQAVERYESFRAGMAEANRTFIAHCLDIFGPNPFRPVAFAPVWRTSSAVALADAMYQSRDFDRMPVLADALEEAGCSNIDILTHCRGDGPHVRGCWVVDLVLGKS